MYNSTSGTEVGSTSSPLGNSSQMVLDARDNLLWLSSGSLGVVAANLTTLSVTVTTGLTLAPGASEGIAYDARDSKVFVLVSSSMISVRDSATGGPMATVSAVGTNDTALVFDPADDQLYVAGDSVTPVNGSSGTVDGDPISLGPSHRVLTGEFEPSRNAVYLSSRGILPGKQGALLVLDGSSLSASESSVSEIPVGEAPDAIGVVSAPTVSPDSGEVWVGNALSGTVSVIASEPEVTGFSVQPSVVDSGHPVAFSLTASGGAGGFAVTYSGLPAGCQAENALYLNCEPTQVGSFRVTAILNDSLGDFVRSSVNLTVMPSLSVTVSLNVSSVVDVGYPVLATAHATGGSPPYHYEWSFGDGTQSSGPNASHAYGTPGAYSISVSAEDSTAAFNSTSLALTVVPRPFASLSVTPGNRTDVDFPLNFTPQVDGGVGGSSYLWTFGDGTQSTELNVTHAWMSAGSFSVKFESTDRLGISANRTVNITVAPALAGSFGAGNVSAGSPASPGSVVNFTSKITGGTSPYSITWTFGDGSFATGASTSHAYASAGNYTVGATVVDAVGGRVSANLTVVVATVTTSSGGIVSTNDNFSSGLFLGLVFGATAAAVILYIAAPRKGDRPPAKPVSPYVPP